MKTLLASTVVAALGLLGGCSSPSAADADVTSSAHAADRTGDDVPPPTVRQLDALRGQLFDLDHLTVWYDCAAKLGDDFVRIRLRNDDHNDLWATAQYTLRDYNNQVLTTTLDLGKAKIARTIPGPTVHIVFSLQIGGQAAELDAGEVWTGNGKLTTPGLTVPFACGAYDAPFDVGVGSSG
jgi:hypothetical protein